MSARAGARTATSEEHLDDGDLALPPQDEGKAEKKSKKDKKNKVKGKGKGKLIAIIIAVVIIGGFAAVMAFNIGGLREDHVMPVLRNLPLVGGLFGEAEEEAVAQLTPEQLRNEHLLQAQQIESLQSQNNQLQQRIADASAEIAELEWFYENWQTYIYARAALDQWLAHTFPGDFTEFFADVDPRNIEQLLPQAEEILEFERETGEIVRTLNQMDEAGAGEVLADLMTRNTPLMLRALHRMSPIRRAEIFDTMEANIVATILILMSVPEPVFAPIVPPVLPEPPLPGTPPPVIPLDEEDEAEELEDIAEDIDEEIVDDVVEDEVEGEPEAPAE